MPRAGIALGSNLGDRLENLRAACGRLREIANDGDLLTAPVYRTAPVDCPDGSPEFYNSVVEIGFDGSASELLDITQRIERDLGRTAAGRNAPRVVDIDLLYFGDETISSDSLALPHPRITVRRFVLQPLADIRPNLVLAGYESSVRQLLMKLISDEPELEVVSRFLTAARHDL